MQSTSMAAAQRLHATTEHLVNSSISRIHPHLVQSVDPVKGRQLRTSQPVSRGEVLLIDAPYAVIPVVDNPLESDSLLCSNPQCNQKARHDAPRILCANNCIAHVAWCSPTCQHMDQKRHAFECTWLKRYTASIRSKWSEYDFGMLWLIVRILATRHIEMQGNPMAQSQNDANHLRFASGWPAIQSFCGSPDTWAHSQVRAWGVQVKKYLRNSPCLPHGMAGDEAVALICQEEANSFGLYPRETGTLVDRGEQFAAAVYPRAAIANHSCSPNMSHKPDTNGNMVFVASRDIAAGEECCISYFDLTQYVDLKSRREHLQRSFRFVCQCDRCLSEESPEVDGQWHAFPFIDAEEPADI